MKKVIFSFILFVLIFSCDKNTYNYEGTTGSIKGKVVFDPSYQGYPQELEGALVKIPGSSASAYTDEEGEYILFSIPPGTYKLTAFSDRYNYIYGEIENVVVSNGITTNATNIALSTMSSNDDFYYIYDLDIIDSLGYHHYFSSGGTIIPSKSIEIQGRVVRSPMNYNGIDTTVSITLNNTKFAVLTNEKGIFRKSLILPQIENSISVWIGDTNQPNPQQGYFYDAKVYYLKSNIEFNIDLDWNSNNSGGGDAGDFDVHLISHQENDSCWYKNTRPDWGIKDFTYDDPRLRDDVNSYGRSYGSEDMDTDYASSGSYTVKVYYFSNESDSTKKIRPGVRIWLNNNYDYYTAPFDMSVGERWVVAEVNIPTGIVNMINRIEKVPLNKVEQKITIRE